MRRGSDDLRWVEVRGFIRARDVVDRLPKILTVKEALLLQRLAPKPLLLRLDPAHIYPVSGFPALTYEVTNLILLNRYSHENLDNYKHPITGAPISKEEVYAWWERIAGKVQ